MATVRVTSATAAADTVAAHHAALSTRLPVALIVPRGVEAEVSSADVAAAVAGRAPWAPRSSRPTLALDAAEQALREAGSIVVLAGRGAADPVTSEPIGASR